MKIFAVIIVNLTLCSANAFGQSWFVFDVDAGVKPALALDSRGNPHISYMLEDIPGFVRHGVWRAASADFAISEVETGYFYGPLDLAMDNADIPHIAYHDHDSQEQTLARLIDGVWEIIRLAHPGHDGWDNAIVIDADDRVHLSSVDPAQFNGSGIEYTVWDANGWNVIDIGSGPVDYEHGTSIALDAAGNPHIVFHDHVARDLKYAHLTGDIWMIETVEAQGDVGRFASLQLDATGKPRISYFRNDDDGTGAIRYARWDGSDWEISTVDAVQNVTLGFVGARNMTSLALGDDDAPHIAFCDETTLKYAVLRNGFNWDVETIIEIEEGENILGQLTSLKLDANGRAHIAFHDVTGTNPLNGNVKYATNNPAAAVGDPFHGAGRNIKLFVTPQPAQTHATLNYTVANTGPVDVRVYDLLGAQVAAFRRNHTTPGEYALNWDTGALSGGVYTVQLQTPEALISVPALVNKP